jgi:hypothetical protein
MALRVTLSLCLLLACSACFHKTVANFKGDDKLMVDGAKRIMLAINAYHTDTSDWPADIRSAEKYLAAGTSWPENPYTHAPIEDSGSADFDPAKSIGTVYYEKYVRDEQIANYRLHVFGRSGRLMIFGNSAFGAE